MPRFSNQFFASLQRFQGRPAFAGWTWLETEVKTPSGALLFGRSTDSGGNIEGIHDQFESVASLLVDEAKSIRDDVLDALSRCHTTFRLFMSSTGPAYRRVLQDLHSAGAFMEDVSGALEHVSARVARPRLKPIARTSRIACSG